VLRQKINNRNRRFRRRFQHKVVAIDAIWMPAAPGA
jgi:hypothetical protein